MHGLRRGQLPDTGESAAVRHDLLVPVPLGVGVACVLAVVAQAVVGWPVADFAGAAGRGPRHTAVATPGPSTTSTSDQTPIVFTEPTDEPASTLARFYGQAIDWKRCTGSERDLCGTVTVPIDYLKPAGNTVRIALRKVPALDNGRRKGTLFINPGGPGASGIEFAKNANDYFSRNVRRVWDIVGFDPRGIGESGSFACLRPAELDAMYAADPTPETAAEGASIARAARDRLRGCLQRGGELAHNMSSEDVAKDLDIMRAAVGDSHLNYVGISYGTLVGGLYAELFTSRVGLMVLDSAVSGSGVEDASVGQPDVDRWAGEDARSFDAMFATYVKGCTERDEGCPLGTDPKQAEAKLMKLLDGLESTPLPTRVYSLRKLTQGWASVALRSGLLYPETWADLDHALAEALEQQNGTGLAYLAMMDVGREGDGSYSDATYGSNGLPVKCADWPVQAADRLVPSASIRTDHPLWAFVFPDTSPPCDGWTGTIRDTLVVEAAPATPVLVIGNERDQVTPIDSTKDMARSLAGSRLVTVDAEGHGAYAAGNDCADEAVDTYLVDAIAPKNLTRCPAR